MLYRSTYQFQAEGLSDIYNSELYKILLQEGFFNEDHDICLIGSCDGYQIFKQKQDDCWVFLFINANLPPLERVKQENLMVEAVIPGPNSPKNMNTFLYPLIQELKLLEGMKYLILYIYKLRNYSNIQAHHTQGKVTGFLSI